MVLALKGDIWEGVLTDGEEVPGSTSGVAATLELDQVTVPRVPFMEALFLSSLKEAVVQLTAWLVPGVFPLPHRALAMVSSGSDLLKLKKLQAS